MVFDRADDEPDEYDPEEEFRDPDSDSLTIPELPTENAGSDLRSDLREELGSDTEEELTPSTEFPSTDDVSSELQKEFWALVLVLNAAILAYALAALFFVFESATTVATSLFLGGFVLTGFAVRRYRRIRSDHLGSDGGADDDTAPEAAGSDDDEGDGPAPE